ncbi:hypothetical protein N182_26425 [Sinorhizobium sp. GL2]|nr:hypothetical protein N182_26425 [Sinorhizobium sp. GL2]
MAYVDDRRVNRALLLTAFASSGWWRSEIAGLQVADLVDEESIRDDPNDANSPSLGSAKSPNPVRLLAQRQKPFI